MKATVGYSLAQGGVANGGDVARGGPAHSGGRSKSELGNDSNDWMSHVNRPKFKTPAEAVDGCRVGGQETTAIF